LFKPSVVARDDLAVEDDIAVGLAADDDRRIGKAETLDAPATLAN
jgi:hypothetical protein